jgi:hypothetical protein
MPPPGVCAPAVTRPLPLRRAADAHRVIDERRTAGKTVLVVERPDLPAALGRDRRRGAELGRDGRGLGSARRARPVARPERARPPARRPGGATSASRATSARRCARQDASGPHPVNRHSPKLAARDLRGPRTSTTSSPCCASTTTASARWQRPPDDRALRDDPGMRSELTALLEISSAIDSVNPSLVPAARARRRSRGTSRAGRRSAGSRSRRSRTRPAAPRCSSARVGPVAGGRCCSAATSTR